MLFKFIRFTFSASGPLLISFGTYSGFTSVLTLLFGLEVSPDNSKMLYCVYLLFLYGVGILFAQESFDVGILRDQVEDSLATRINKESRQESSVSSFLSGGYSLIVKWVLERKKITFYDVFKKPSYWEEYNEKHKEFPIFRLQMNGKSLEARFPIEKKGIVLIRETKPNSHKYDDWREESLLGWKFLSIFTPWEFFKQLVWG